MSQVLNKVNSETGEQSSQVEVNCNSICPTPNQSQADALLCSESLYPMPLDGSVGCLLEMFWTAQILTVIQLVAKSLKQQGFIKEVPTAPLKAIFNLREWNESKFKFVDKSSKLMQTIFENLNYEYSNYFDNKRCIKIENKTRQF